jgi:hypothetical protein
VSLLAPAPRPLTPETPALELPDLDSGEDADEVDVGVFELDMGGELDNDEPNDALDAFEVEIQQQSDAGSSEAASDLDIGDSGLSDALPEVPAARDDDEQAPGSTEIDWQLNAPLESDDPSTDAELGDDGLEALPELLVDDTDEAGPDLERGLLAAAPEGALPRGPSYEPDWVVLGTSCSALWTNGTDVLGCSERIMQFGRERLSVPLPEGTVASALTRLSTGTVMVATPRGLLELSASGQWATPDPPEGLRGSGATVCELGSTAGAPDLWLRLTTGSLLRRRSGFWERHEAGGQVRSLSCTQTRITLLVTAHRPTLQLSTDAGSSFRELLLPEPAETVALGSAPNALAQERTLAIYDAERGLCVSGDAGETFRMVTGGVNVTAVAIGEHAGAPAVFAALHREGRDVSELILVDPRSGSASLIAELSGETDDESEETGRTQALVYADGYLWAAGGYGLAKLKEP